MDEKYEQILPEDIRSDKATVPYLIILQLNRVNTLLCTTLSSVGKDKLESNVTSGVIFGLRSIESLMSSELKYDKCDYYEKVEELKKDLPNRISDSGVDGNLFKWYDLLVDNFSRVDLGIVRKRTFDFED